MIDKIFGDFKVVSLSYITETYVKVYEAQCMQCGKIRLIQKPRLNNNLQHSNKHCGNYLKQYDNNIGKIVDDRKIISLHSITPQGYRYLTECLICSRVKDEYISNFERGFGTLHKYCTRLIEKDKYFKRLNKIHSCMLQRVTNPNYNEFYYYGGRGINICNRWHMFINFYDDMYISYKNHCELHGESNTSIDRIDTNGDYKFSNCRWATNKEQSNNRRMTPMSELITGNYD